MRILPFKKLVFIVLFFYLPSHSMAWGMMGHRIVGEIADSYLTSKARFNIYKILGTESIAMASNWADFVKSDPSYRYLNPWHYADFNSNLTYDQFSVELQKDTTTDAYTKTSFIIEELSNKNLQQDKKLMYLRLFIHIIGDLHQPLHVSKNGTNGGNDIKVEWFNNPSNLHRLWDEQLVEHQGLSYTEYVKAINHTSKKQRKEWQGQEMSQWLFESYQISNRLHDEITQPSQKLTYQYNFNHLQTLNAQLLKGGVRLAGILNNIFG
jgi:hypothetical protein